MKFETIEIMEALVLNQLRAARHALETINDFLTVQPVEVAGLSFFERSKTEKQIARSICLPTVASTAVNFIFQDKIIGDSDGSIRVGDFYKVMLPLHKVEPTSLPLPYDMGWRITDDKGNTYHHAVAAFLNIFNIKTYSLHSFSGLEWIFSQVKNKKAFVAVSLDNSFLVKKTLDKDSLLKVKEIYPNIGKQPGRHVVFISQFSGNSVFMADSFQYLAPGENPKIKEYRIEEINEYFNYQLGGPTQALIFTREEIDFPSENVKNMFIPDYVQTKIARLSDRFNKAKTI